MRKQGGGKPSPYTLRNSNTKRKLSSDGQEKAADLQNRAALHWISGSDIL
jgi:hypothetical protein